MWSDNSHGQSFVQGQQAFIAGKAFTHGKNFQHSPALDRLCLHSRLGCVLAGGFHGKTEAGFLAQVQEAASVPSASEVSAEAAVFVANRRQGRNLLDQSSLCFRLERLEE
ncbi:hypothetical protein C7M84_000258 [Penaeus vannamei]|uniref:Uncharacterized protein n=1 Tax=Penaeus vannamei TaxID=6689 RepID=A0A423TWZ2_PENVA|nr:hypothetical protein C7M84_000258 [Penaeus vannamei]